MNSKTLGSKSDSDIGLVRDPWGRLTMTDGSGLEYKEVSVMPLFPISQPNQWISILAADGHEIACVEDIQACSKEVAEIITEELSYRDFVPLIQRVVAVSGNTEPCEWSVVTNHGSTRFVLKSEEDIRRLSAYEVMIVDANGGRYRVDDTRKLDSASRRFIEWYV